MYISDTNDIQYNHALFMFEKLLILKSSAVLFCDFTCLCVFGKQLLFLHSQYITWQLLCRLEDARYSQCYRDVHALPFRFIIQHRQSINQSAREQNCICFAGDVPNPFYGMESFLFWSKCHWCLFLIDNTSWLFQVMAWCRTGTVCVVEG